mmetsp:Transcript_91523/g.267818  ORF Transcript_91523/g.267818 Transcript_91523/m.267818 type:complete len:283 (-) Transcript_91523:591-1439(-)
MPGQLARLAVVLEALRSLRWALRCLHCSHLDETSSVTASASWLTASAPSASASGPAHAISGACRVWLAAEASEQDIASEAQSSGGEVGSSQPSELSASVSNGGVPGMLSWGDDHQTSFAGRGGKSWISDFERRNSRGSALRVYRCHSFRDLSPSEATQSCLLASAPVPVMAPTVFSASTALARLASPSSEIVIERLLSAPDECCFFTIAGRGLMGTPFCMDDNVNGPGARKTFSADREFTMPVCGWCGNWPTNDPKAASPDAAIPALQGIEGGLTMQSTSCD